MMRMCLSCLAVLISLSRSVLAQDHLIPDANVFVAQDSYLLKARHVFTQAFDEGVILRSLVLRSFEDEYVVGLQVKGDQIEAFVLEPSSRIWNTELVELYQNGVIIEFTHDGKEKPPEKSDLLRKLKETTPADYRSIKVTRHARPLSRELVEEIRTVWENMLLDVRHPKEPFEGKDGVTYHFSARLKGRGEMSGHVRSPRPESKTGHLRSLADALGDFARGKLDLGELKKTLKRTQAFTNS
jgi:hypothetical protein